MTTPSITHPDRRGFLGLLAAALCLPAFPSPDASSVDLGLPAGWHTLPRRPVTAATDPAAVAILDAIRRGHPVTLAYSGGSTPGARRTLTPALLFTLDGFPHTYLTAYCHSRQATRTFRLDRCLAIA